MSELYSAYAPDAYRLAYLLSGDAEAAADMVQDAFARLFGRFRDLREPDAFYSYLRKTILNLSRDRFRKLRSERAGEARYRSLLQRNHSVGLPDVESRDVIMRALRTLPHRQQVVLVLRYYEDLSERQTAELMGCSVSAVKALVTRAIMAVKERVQKQLLQEEPWT